LEYVPVGLFHGLENLDYNIIRELLVK
jgi:hypothetical protein